MSRRVTIESDLLASLVAYALIDRTAFLDGIKHDPGMASVIVETEKELQKFRRLARRLEVGEIHMDAAGWEGD